LFRRRLDEAGKVAVNGDGDGGAAFVARRGYLDLGDQAADGVDQSASVGRLRIGAGRGQGELQPTDQGG